MIEKNKKKKKENIKFYQKNNKEINRFMTKIQEKDMIKKEKKNWIICLFKDFLKKNNKRKKIRKIKRKKKKKDSYK